MKRKEDVRFVRGQGNYVDDVQLPGMLHGAILRSPVAHARIVSIDTSAALQHPKVLRRDHRAGTSRPGGSPGCRRCRTTRRRCSPPTRSASRGRRSRSSIAEDRYAARDALELIDVEYETLPAVVDARKALDADAPVIRDDKRGQDRQPHLRLGVGRPRRRPTPCSRRADVVVEQDMLLPALAPGADGDLRGRRRLRPGQRQAHALVHDAGAACPPHRLRAPRRAARAQDPGHLARHRRRVRQQGAGLPGLRVRDRRLDRHRQAGEVDGGPLGEPDVDRLRPRLRDEGRDRRDRSDGQDPRRSGST